MTKFVEDKVDIESVQKTIWSKLSLGQSAPQKEHNSLQAKDLPAPNRYQIRYY